MLKYHEFSKRIALTLSVTIFSICLNNSQSIATPDPLFKSIIPVIHRELPKNMAMRLPSYVPDVYKEATYGNSKGTRVYATGARYNPDLEGGSYTISLARTPDCNATSCGVGYIGAARNKPNIWDSQLDRYSKDYEQPIEIKSGLSGYYFYARAGSGGHRHNIYWKQNNVYFYLSFRGFEKSEVKKMATSMASGKAIFPRSDN